MLKVGARRRMSLTRARENITGWLMASPWLIGFLIFTLGPMIASVVLSLHEWDLILPPKWVGLYQFRKMLNDPLVYQSLKVTTIYAATSVPLYIVLGLAVALLLNQDIKPVGFWRTVYFLPSVVSGVAVALLWMWIFNGQFGVLNWLLRVLLDIKGPNWLVDERWALPALVIMSLWGVGGAVLINLAGLQGIPTGLYEAAEIDGANAGQRFWAITIPMMSPVLFFNLVNGMIAALQVFTGPYVMTNGGPNNATLVLMLYLYWNAFSYFRMGYGSALAWLLFFYILILTLLMLRSSSAWVYYEGSLRRR